MAWTEYMGRCCVKSGLSVYMCPNFLWDSKVYLISSHLILSSPYLFFLGHLIPLSHRIFLLHALFSSHLLTSCPFLISSSYFMSSSHLMFLSHLHTSSQHFWFSFSLFIFGPQYCSKKKSIYALLVFLKIWFC